MPSLAKASAILGRALMPQTAKIKISGWRNIAPGSRYQRSIKGVERLVEVVRVLETKDRGPHLHPMHTVEVLIIK